MAQLGAAARQPMPSRSTGPTLMTEFQASVEGEGGVFNFGVLPPAGKK